MSLSLSAARRQNWRSIGIVVKKELVDHFRDRRSLVMSLLYPLLGPVLLAASLYFAGNITNGARDAQPIDIPTVGVAYAPEFAAFMAKYNVNLVAVDGDLPVKSKPARHRSASKSPPRPAAVNVSASGSTPIFRKSKIFVFHPTSVR